MGILIADLDRAIERFSSLLEGSAVWFADDEPLDRCWGRMRLPASPPVEFVSPRSDRSPYRRDLDRRSEGLHHLSFRVADIDDARSPIEALGLPGAQIHA